jgi:hypothetical protein
MLSGIAQAVQETADADNGVRFRAKDTASEGIWTYDRSPPPSFPGPFPTSWG